jgi:predicted Fe-S protein YdhL (DUF1289 family)
MKADSDNENLCALCGRKVQEFTNWVIKKR